MNDQTLPKRADVPVAMTWDLESVYKTNKIGKQTSPKSPRCFPNCLLTKAS